MSTVDDSAPTEEVLPLECTDSNSGLNKNEGEGEKTTASTLDATVVVSETVEDEEENSTFTKSENLDETTSQFLSRSNSFTSELNSSLPSSDDEKTLEGSDEIMEYDSLEESNIENLKTDDSGITLDTVSKKLDGSIFEVENNNVNLTEENTISIPETVEIFKPESICEDGDKDKQNNNSANEIRIQIEDNPEDSNETDVSSEINIDLVAKEVINEEQIPEKIDSGNTVSVLDKEKQSLEKVDTTEENEKTSSEETSEKNAVEELIKILHTDFLNTVLLREHKQLTETVLSQMNELATEDQSEKIPSEDSGKSGGKLIPEEEKSILKNQEVLRDEECKTEPDLLKIEAVEDPKVEADDDLDNTEVKPDQEKADEKTESCDGLVGGESKIEVFKTETEPAKLEEKNNFDETAEDLPERDILEMTGDELIEQKNIHDKIPDEKVPSQELEIGEDKTDKNSRGVHKFVQKLGSLIFSSITTDNAPLKTLETPIADDNKVQMTKTEILDQKMENKCVSLENGTMMENIVEMKATEHKTDVVFVSEKQENNSDTKSGDVLKPASQRRESSGVIMYSVDVIPTSSKQLRLVENQFLEDPELPGYDKYLELKIEINQLQQTVANHVLEIKQKERQILQLFPNKVKIQPNEKNEETEEKVLTRKESFIRDLEDDYEDKSIELFKAREIMKQLETQSNKLREDLRVKTEECAKLQQYLCEADVVLETYLRRLHDTSNALKREQETSKKNSENLQRAIASYDDYKRSALILQSKEINYKQIIEKLTSDYNKLLEVYQSQENGEKQRLTLAGKKAQTNAF